MSENSAEDLVWQNINPDHIWVMDKLILSRKLNYNCGPVGLDVPHPGWYMVRPCVNMQGMGLGSQKIWIEKESEFLPIGHFWCEFFTGRHLSVDYTYGRPTLCVEGFKQENTFIQWDKWVEVDDFSAIERIISFPSILSEFIDYPTINCEFIGNKLIEVHFRQNEDFAEGITEFIPVWEGEGTEPPEGYRYKPCPEQNRIGAFIK